MKLLFFTYLWTLGFCIINATCSDVNNLNGLVENIIPASSSALDDLLPAFRMRYRRFEQAIQEAVLNPTDATVLARLGDDIYEFITLVAEVSCNCLSVSSNLHRLH